MSFAPLLNAPLVIQLHAFAAMAALLLGIVQFSSRKGTLPHRTVGWIWVALMLSIAISSFWIHGKSNRMIGVWSPIHLLSILVLVMVPLAVFAAHHHRVRAHKITMISVFIGGLIVAGLFTFVPGRIMNAVAFGQ